VISGEVLNAKWNVEQKMQSFSDFFLALPIRYPLIAIRSSSNDDAVEKCQPEIDDDGHNDDRGDDDDGLLFAVIEALQAVQ
jgi:hypothetical protein